MLDEAKYPTKPQYFINNAKEQGPAPATVEANDDFICRFVDLYASYDEQCQQAVDFAELLLRCWELLRYNDAIRQHYQHRFRHVLVDEFQDTNVLTSTSGSSCWRLRHGQPAAAKSVFAVGAMTTRASTRFGAPTSAICATSRTELRVRHLISWSKTTARRPHPRFGQPSDRPQSAAAGQEPAHGRRPRRAGAGVLGRVGRAGSLLDRRGDPRPDRSGMSRCEIAILLSQQRAVAGDPSTRRAASSGIAYRVYGGCAASSGPK